MLHHFSKSIEGIMLPDNFTFPFNYESHLLSVMASKQVQDYVLEQGQWKLEIDLGKMFGVLVVQTSGGELGFLAAYSGNLDQKNNHPFFVPSIYDLLNPLDYFKIEEDVISNINREIEKKLSDPAYLTAKERLEDAQKISCMELSSSKGSIKAAKLLRDERRKQLFDKVGLDSMLAESQYLKAEHKRLERRWKECLLNLQSEHDILVAEIEVLKSERKGRSADLQQWLFKQYEILNFNGKFKNLAEIFKNTVQKVPPAGAGECAAPKLLQYAFVHNLKPLAMAEFWWGESPKTEIRHHGNYYPACKGKCEPILNYMMEGLDVDVDPLFKLEVDEKLDILFEDDSLLVINKSAGMLSVPGKSTQRSVYDIIKKLYLDATGPLIVHRLDLFTSGVLLIAKTKQVHKVLQEEFRSRRVKKRYVALLDGEVAQDKGVISLSMSSNFMDRPRQMVSEEHGKPAITQYEVLERSDGRTKVLFYPITGRTHQLRVHAAHPLGLNAPILGDELYGQKADRLYLHAEYLEFRHPVTNETISVQKEAEFFYPFSLLSSS